MAEDYYPDHLHDRQYLYAVKLKQKIKPRTVLVYAENLPPNEDNIKVYFDGVQVNAEIATQTDIDTNEARGFIVAGETGSMAGTVKADPNGKVTLKFTIPENHWVGEKQIALYSDSGLVNVASTIFCLGLSEHWKEVSQFRPVPSFVAYGDPIAQTFEVERDMFLTSVEVWVHTVPTENASLVLGLRPLNTAGYPSEISLGETSLAKNEVLSQMGTSIVTNPTTSNSVKFTFDTPIYLQKGGYAFVVGSAIDGYTLFASEIGKQIVGTLDNTVTGGILTSSAYPPGTLFRSSSGSAWVADHKRDLMFKINRAKFTSSGVVYLSSATANHSFSHFNHLCETLMPLDTKIESYFSKDNGITYNKYLPVQVKFGKESAKDIIALNEMVNNLKFKFELSTNTNWLSPVLLRHPNQFHSLYYLENGVYRTKEVECEDFENIYVWINEKENHGSITYEVSFDSGSTWYNLPLISSTLLEEEFYERYLGGSVDSITSSVIDTATKFIVRITFSNSPDYRYLTPIFRRLRVLTY